MTFASALYIGRVGHRRTRPTRHALGYRVFNILVDLDEVAALPGRLRVFSHNRFNLLSFHDRDHGDGSDTPLRAQVEAKLARSGLALAGGPIRLLCLPRLLGYVFNPLSVYFCHAPDGRLACIVYEVSNTFGERHSYVLPVGSDPDDKVVRQSCAKRFHVSPFLDMDLVYDFAIRPPDAEVTIGVTARDAGGPLLTTAFSGQRQELSDRALVRAVMTHPLLTMKVVAGIHWEALRIWLKGNKVRAKPPAPEEAVTAVLANAERT